MTTIHDTLPRPGEDDGHYDAVARDLARPPRRVVRAVIYLTYEDEPGEEPISRLYDPRDIEKDIADTLAPRGGLLRRGGLDFDPLSVEVVDAEWGTDAEDGFRADTCPACGHTPHGDYCGRFEVYAGNCRCREASR